MGKHGTELRLASVRRKEGKDGIYEIVSFTPSGQMRVIPLDAEEALVLTSRIARLVATDLEKLRHPLIEVEET